MPSQPQPHRARTLSRADDYASAGQWGLRCARRDRGTHGNLSPPKARHTPLGSLEALALCTLRNSPCCTCRGLRRDGRASDPTGVAGLLSLWKLVAKASPFARSLSLRRHLAAQPPNSCTTEHLTGRAPAYPGSTCVCLPLELADHERACGRSARQLNRTLRSASAGTSTYWTRHSSPPLFLPSPMSEERILPTPGEMFAYLGRVVRGQARAKQDIVMAVNNHYLAQAYQARKGRDLGQHHQQLILSTGAEKTYTVRMLAQYPGVPMSFASAASLAEAGYACNSVDIRLNPRIDVETRREAAATLPPSPQPSSRHLMRVAPRFRWV